VAKPDPRLRVETEANVPPEVRERQLDDIRQRLEAGELDSDLAAIETAFALLDGDVAARAQPRRRQNLS
jgi:hypothetical protein